MSSLTFGPEWLRALSGGDGSEAQTKTLTTKRFKLADFRYSKEDMLELFEENISIPIDLKEFGDVIMQETQNQPLSFIPLSKDEERLLVAGINSSVLFRLSGRGAPLRGRGAIRGARGRGRGDGQANFYRTLSNEESNFNTSREPYQRRPWGEGARGGSSDRGSGRGEPPGGRGASFEQRGRIPSDRGGLTDREAWRGSQEEDDGGGWRVSGQRSWRKGSADASSNWRTDSVKDEGTDNQNKRTWSNNGTYWRQLSSSSNSGLPEWCDDDVDQDVGTFDASGQFKSMKPSEDSASKYEKEEGDQPVFDEPQEKSNGEAGKKLETDAISKLENKKEKGGIEHNDESKRERLPPSHVNGNSSNSASKTSLQDIGCEESRKSKPLTVEEIESSALAQTESQSKSQNELRVVNSRSSQNDENLTMEDVNAAANGMQKILTAGQAQRGRHPNVDEDADHNIDHIKNLIEKLDDEIDNIYPTNQLSGPDQEVDDCNITDPSIVCAKKAEPGVLIKGMQDWIYRDPQGEIQGPFSSEEMLQWFKAGYFTMGLLVRRVCDEIFLPLGDLIKLWNRVPFQPGPELPSITSQIYAAQLLRRQQQEEYKMMLMQQQRKMQQQQHHQQQQQQLQFQQQEMLLLQQMKEQQQQQQMKEVQQRPHNLNVSQEVSIWGDSPAPTPNLVSTPWSPTSSQPELLTWNASKSQNVASEAHKDHGQSTGKSDQTKVSDATTKSSQGDECDDSSMLESEESAGGSTSQEAQNVARHNGSASKSEEDQDQKTTGQSSQKRAQVKHPVPSRTRKLSTAAPMVLGLKPRESRSPPEEMLL